MSLSMHVSSPLDYTQQTSRLLEQWLGRSLDPNELITNLLPQELQRIVLATRNLYKPRLYVTTPPARFPQDTYSINLDVQQFEPHDITVRVSEDKVVTVECKHEEKEDEHGLVSRHFVRRCVMPQSYDIERLECRLSSDGVLTIFAPQIMEGVQPRYIPIIQTGQPSQTQDTETKEEKEMGDN